MIKKARAENRDIAVAAARVIEAQAQTTIQGSVLFPQINAQAQAVRAPLGEGGRTITGQPFTPGNTFALGLGASYEFDFWGLARDNLRAAKEALKSARYAQTAVALTVTANVADTYFSVLALRERIAIANQDIAAINDILEIVKIKVATGVSSRLDLAQEQAQVESVAAQVPALEEQEQEARIALAVLLGQLPEGFSVNTSNSNGVRPGGHLKIPHPWPGQNPPPGSGGTRDDYAV